MNRLCIATLASVLVCGSAFAQGRPAAPALTNPVITGGTISGAAGGFTTLSASGAVSGAGITALLASPGPIGSVGAGTGAFTTLGVSGTISGAGVTALLAPYAPLASPTFTGTLSGAAAAFSGNATVGGAFGAKGTATLLLNTGRDISITDGTTRAQIGVANGNPLWFQSHLQLASVQTPQNAVELTLLGFSGNTVPLSGTQTYGLLKSSAVLSGSSTSDIFPNYFFVQGNGFAASGPNGLYGMTAQVTMASGSSGAYTGFQSQVTIPPGQTGITHANITGGQIQITASSNAGGISGNLSGRAYGTYHQAGLNAGATYWASVSGNETDIGVQTGASAGGVFGMGAILLPSHAVHGLENIDTAFTAGCAGCSTPWDYALRVGGVGTPFAITSTGTIIQTVYGNSGASAAHGADFLPVNFSGTAFRSNAFSVDGSGDIQSGTCYVKPSTAGASVDCSGSIATAATLVAGGSSWPLDGQVHVASDANGGIYALTINGSGVVTAISMYRAPYVSGSTPSNPVTLIPDPPAAYRGATGLTINLTWQARSLLTLQSSGGMTALGGLAQLKSYTVATLPAAAAGNAGAIAYVTDATSPTYRGALTGGGAVKTMVFSDGAAWTSH